MAQLSTSTVNGDLTITGVLSLYKEIDVPGGRMDSLSITNDLRANNLTNSVGSIDLITSGDNLYHKIGENSYKIFDSNNYIPPTVDSELSSTSINAVQNKVITGSIVGINGEISIINNAIESIKESYLKLEGGHLTGNVTSDAGISAKTGSFTNTTIIEEQEVGLTATNIKGGTYFTEQIIEGESEVVIDNTNTALKVEGGIYATNGIGASKVFNAVWNDIADFVEVPWNFKIEYGKAYTRNRIGDIVLANEGKALGIASDTYGFGVGHKEGKKQMPIAIGGWVLAYIDKLYEPMTPLKAGKDGVLTELLDTDPAYLCLGFFDRTENFEDWNGIQVNGRHWVKVK